MPGQYEIFVGTDFTRAIAALTAVDRTLSGNVNRRMRAEAEKLIDIAQVKVRALPTPRNAGHTGLRNRIAAGTFLAGQGSNLRVTTSMPEEDEAIIPRGMDRGAAGWRHPVFGNMNVWVRQNGYSWFAETMESGQQPIERALTNELEAAADFIDRSS
jgi:hypothetical protein